MSASIDDDEDMLLQSYCDGALDPASAADVERRLAADGTLQARRDQIMALRRALRSLPQDEMPQQLLARVSAAVDSATDTTVNTERPRQRSWSWRAMAASAMIGAIVAGSSMTMVDRYQSREQVARQIVAGHIRSLLAPQPFDIASSDRHTVKPWFTTRIPESPLVVDLAQQGFVLAGGRVDVLDRAPVATIVYRHAAHVVSLTTLPPGQTVPDQTIAGYNVLSWSDNAFTYVAVSDLPREDLATFEHAFTAAAASVR
jgi:anti-sigma factor RsiW